MIQPRWKDILIAVSYEATGHHPVRKLPKGIADPARKFFSDENVQTRLPECYQTTSMMR
jgi:hypothetical protein